MENNDFTEKEIEILLQLVNQAQWPGNMIEQGLSIKNKLIQREKLTGYLRHLISVHEPKYTFRINEYSEGIVSACEWVMEQIEEGYFDELPPGTELTSEEMLPPWC